MCLLCGTTGGGVGRGHGQVNEVQVEKAMITNLRAIMAQAVAAYATTARKQWVLEWPGQAVLAVSGIYWTQQVRCDIPDILSGEDSLILVCAALTGSCEYVKPAMLEDTTFAMRVLLSHTFGHMGLFSYRVLTRHF